MSKSKKIDWENFRKTACDSASEAAKETNLKLSAELALMTSLTKYEIEDIFPSESHLQDFSELMEIIKSRTSRNNKINQIVDNSEKFAGVVVSLLGKIF